MNSALMQKILSSSVYIYQLIARKLHSDKKNVTSQVVTSSNSHYKLTIILALIV